MDLARRGPRARPPRHPGACPHRGAARLADAAQAQYAPWDAPEDGFVNPKLGPIGIPDNTTVVPAAPVSFSSTKSIGAVIANTSTQTEAQFSVFDT